MEAVSVAQASFMALAQIARPGKKKARSGAPNPTGAKVRERSLEAGTFEDGFYFTYAKGETDRLYKRAEELLANKNAIRRLARAEDRVLTEEERLATLITNAALRVFKQLLQLARKFGGKVFPTYSELERCTGLCRDSVSRALSILERMGLLDRQRRCVAVEPPADRPKARYEQTSNVYRFKFPNRLVRFLPRWLRPAPLPDDVVQQHADRIAEIEAMKASRTLRQQITDDTPDAELRRLLLSMAAHFENDCESDKTPQPLHESYSYMSNGVGLVGQRGNA